MRFNYKNYDINFKLARFSQIFINSSKIAPRIPGKLKRLFDIRTTVSPEGICLF